MIRSFFIGVCLILSWDTWAASCLVGYGYSTFSISATRQNHFYSGFRYGIKKAYQDLDGQFKGPCSDFKNVEILLQFDDGKNPMASMGVVNDLVAKKALLIAGFPSSHGAMLAAKAAHKNKVAAFFEGPSASDLSEYKDFIFSTSPGRESHSDVMMQEMLKSHAGKKVLVIAKRDSFFSMDIVKNLKKANQRYGNKVELVVLYFDKNPTLKESDFKTIPLDQVGAIYMTPYAVEVKPIYAQLASHFKNNVQYYGSSSWLSMDLSIIADIPKKYKTNLRAVTSIRDAFERIPKNDFHQSFLKENGRAPALESFSGYNLGYVVGQVLARVKEPHRKAVLHQMRQMGCVMLHKRTQICRKPNGFSNREIGLYQWSPQGFKLIGHRIPKI